LTRHHPATFVIFTPAASVASMSRILAANLVMAKAITGLRRRMPRDTLTCHIYGDISCVT
jgi:hypothetical protein